MSTLSRKDGATTPTSAHNSSSLSRKPSSLMTDEDWDHLLAKEQQQKEDNEGGKSSVVTEENMTEATISPLRQTRAGESIHKSPIKVGKESGRYSTPSSPSEILRLTKRRPVEGNEDDTQVVEAAQFEKELGDWINKEQSPFECGGGGGVQALQSA